MCLGSNVKPRRERIWQAVEMMRGFAEVRAMSLMKESRDITGCGEPYVNMAVECLTDCSPEEFSAAIEQIENAGGRIRSGEAAKERVHIDIDLVVWDGLVVSETDYAREYFAPLLDELRPVRECSR